MFNLLGQSVLFTVIWSLVYHFFWTHSRHALFGGYDEEMRNLSWSDFMMGIMEPELIQYLKERRLYINDKVESEEEV